MAKQKVLGPYRVKKIDTGYELTELVDGELVSLRPRRTYDETKRTHAYQQMVRMNRRSSKAAMS